MTFKAVGYIVLWIYLDSDCSNLNDDIHLSDLFFFQQSEEWWLVQSLTKKKNIQLQDELELILNLKFISEWPEK